MTPSTIRIGRRFRGPADTANGGYTCGLIASLARRPVTVRLQKPIPLDTTLTVREHGDRLEVLDDGDVIAQARPGEVGDLAPPHPPSFAEAVAASRHYPGFAAHPAPDCFVCGPRRAEGDALRIFPGPYGPPGAVAAPFTPDASLGADGAIAAEHVWAVLDCPGFVAAAPDMRPMLLGELTARLERDVRVGEPHVVVGWVVGSSGRKHEAGTALYDREGRRCGLARALWIEPRPA